MRTASAQQYEMFVFFVVIWDYITLVSHLHHQKKTSSTDTRPQWYLSPNNIIVITTHASVVSSCFPHMNGRHCQSAVVDCVCVLARFGMNGEHSSLPKSFHAQMKASASICMLEHWGVLEQGLTPAPVAVADLPNRSQRVFEAWVWCHLCEYDQGFTADFIQ